MNPDHPGGDGSIAEDKLLALRFEYAWKWFEFHASQRITMFSFFLIASGILANAYVGVAKEGLWLFGILIGGIGVLASFAFVFLDCRNRQLLGLAEDVLERLEREALFPTSPERAEHASTRGLRAGILLREAEEEANTCWCRKVIFKHKWWIRGLEIAFAAFFAAATVLAWIGYSGSMKEKNTQSWRPDGGLRGQEVTLEQGLWERRRRLIRRTRSLRYWTWALSSVKACGRCGSWRGSRRRRPDPTASHRVPRCMHQMASMDGAYAHRETGRGVTPRPARVYWSGRPDSNPHPIPQASAKRGTITAQAFESHRIGQEGAT